MRHLLLGLRPVGSPVGVVRFAGDTRFKLDYAAREAQGVRLLADVPVSTIAAPDRAVPLLRASTQLVYYRAARALVKATAILAWAAAIDEAMPHDISVIHLVGTGRELIGFAAHAVARRRGIPLTVLPALHIGTWGDSDLDLDLYRHADSVIALSDIERDHLVGFGLAPERIAVCGLAPAAPRTGDGHAFRVRHGLGDESIVLFIGRKWRVKGYHALLQAIGPLRALVPGLTLVSIGREGDQPYPEVGEGLLDLGEVDEQTKADALAACDVLCLPSETEAFGIVYVEAWSYGRPVVALDTPTARALISDGNTGLLARDTEADLIRCISVIVQNPDQARAMGAAGEREYRERYTWDAVIDRHLEVFAHACGIHVVNERGASDSRPAP